MVRTSRKEGNFILHFLRKEGIPYDESWWDAQIAEVSEMPKVEAAHAEWAATQAQERYFL